MAEHSEIKGHTTQSPGPSDGMNETKGKPGKAEDWKALGEQKAKENISTKKPKF